METLLETLEFRLVGEDINTGSLVPDTAWDQNPATLVNFLNTVQGDKAVTVKKYDSGRQYAVIYDCGTLTWDGRHVTNNKHFDRYVPDQGADINSIPIPWNSIDKICINKDKDGFPNGEQTIIDSRLWIDITNGNTYDQDIPEDLPFIFMDGPEILDPQGGIDEEGNTFPASYNPPKYESVVRPTVVSKYKYMRFISFKNLMDAYRSEIRNRKFIKD